MLQMLRPLEELQKASLRFPLQCAATRRIDTAVAALQWVQSCSHQMGMGARAEPDVLERLAEAGTRVRADVAALPAPPLNTPELAPQHDALVAARAAREQWVARALRALDSACALADVRVLLADPAGAVGTATEQLLLELYAGWLERGAPPLGQQQRRAARGGWAKDSVYWVAWKGWLPWPAVIEEIKREAPVAGGAAGGAAGSAAGATAPHEMQSPTRGQGAVLDARHPSCQLYRLTTHPEGELIYYRYIVCESC